MPDAEITSISRRYESFRLRDPSREKAMLSSILEVGVREPLQCVRTSDPTQPYLLLDGFKRLRCCLKLSIASVPVAFLGEDEVDSILSLIRISNARSLTTVEQARFVDELHSHYGLSVGEIALRLERSAAWVSVRLGIIEKMSETVKEAVFSGRFPLRSYLYTLQPFTRVKSEAARLERFVSAVAGKGLSTRDIERLAYGYFRGGESLRKQIEEGNLGWTLRKLKGVPAADSEQEGLSEREANLLRDLQLVQKYMGRVLAALGEEDKLGSEAFLAQALVLVEGVLGQQKRFISTLRSFHDRRADPRGGAHPVRAGKAEETDRAVSQAGHKDRAHDSL